jgi:hypothetical protein
MMTTIVAGLRSVREVADGLFTLFSLICVPALSGASFMWILEYPKVSQSLASRPSVAASAGTDAEVYVPWFANSPRIAYKLYLIDGVGRIVYDYPEASTDIKNSPEFGNMLFKIPREVPPGDYKLVADVKYLMSPQQTGIIQMEIAQINVKSK